MNRHHRPPSTPVTRTLPRPQTLLLAFAFAFGLGGAGLAATMAQSGGIRRAWPSNGSREVDLGTSIGLEFTRPMQHDSVAQALNIRPFVPIELSWTPYRGGERLEIQPQGTLLPSTVYRLEVGNSIRGADGGPVIAEPYVWSFTTRGPRVEFRFDLDLPVQQISPRGGRGVPLRLLERGLTLDATLYALDMPAFASRYAALTPGRLDEIDLAGLTRVAQWAQPVEAVPGRAAEITLPESTSPGLYVLDVRHETTLDTQTLLVYGDPALAVKKGRTGLTAWLSTIGETDWAREAELTTYDAHGAPLDSATADPEGVAVFEEAADAAFVLARTTGPDPDGGHIALAGLDEAWLAEPRLSVPPPALTGHIHTDRPIYRPGQTMRFKATLRRNVGEDLRRIAPGSTISVTLRDARNAAVSEQSLVADDYGSVHGELRLGDEVALGAWVIEAILDDEMVRGAFQVEEYRKPDFEVEVETAEPGYARSDSVQVTVHARHYHGAPVTEADLRLRVFRDRGAPGGDEPVFDRSGRTDAQGRWTTTLTVDAVGSWLFEAEVVGAGRRPVFAEATVPVYASGIALALDATRSAVEIGRPITLTLNATDRRDQPVADTVVDLAFWRRSGRGDERVRDVQARTDASGRAVLAPADLPAGLYRIEATARDTRGRRANAGLELWVFDPSDADQWAGALEITADHDRYAPGDRALLMIKSPYQARALVTIEGAEVYDERVVRLGGLTTVELPITDAHAPNVTARVLLWLPQDRSDDRAEGRLAFAETALAVPPEHRRLGVAVTADQERYEPGEEATFTIRVTDAEGAPVQAQLSMALVDAAVLALYADPNGAIFDAFWQPRARQVDTFDGLQPSHWDARFLPPGGWTPTPEPSTTPRPTPPGGPPRSPTPSPGPTPVPEPTRAPATATSSPAAPTPSPAPGRPRPTSEPPAPGPGTDLDADDVAARLRRAFPDTAYWNATLVTDANGEVSVTLTLPDSLTTWQALVRAVTVDTLVGQGSGTVQVQQPISAEPVLPRFAVQGDRFVLDVLARNDLGGTLAGQCALEAPGLVTLDPGSRDLSLALGRTEVARWSVVASEVGAGTIQADLSTAEGGDAVELPLEIQPFTVPELITRSGSTRDSVTLPIEVPFNAMPHDTRIDVLLSSGVTHSVLEGTEQLLNFPYGCVEQTTSKMLPNAVVGRLINQLDLAAPEIRTALAEFMPVGIQKLYGFQHPDGSWGFWHGGRNLYLTTYVLHALTMIEAAGYDIDESVLDHGFDWLARTLPFESEPTLRAYGLYVMAEAGRGDLVQVERLWGEREQLDAFALAALAIAMDAASANSRAEQALDLLAEMSAREGDMAFWSADQSRRVSWRSMASNAKSTAMALVALTRLRPESPLAPMAARWLMAHRQGAGWGSTQATIFAVVALSDYMLVSGDPYATYDWQVLLDGEVVAEGRVDEDSHSSRLDPIVITGDRLTPGAHALTFQKSGHGTLYYAMAARMSLYHDGFAPTKPQGLGIDVARRYDPVEGAPAEPPEEREWQVGASRVRRAASCRWPSDSSTSASVRSSSRTCSGPTKSVTSKSRSHTSRRSSASASVGGLWALRRPCPNQTRADSSNARLAVSSGSGMCSSTPEGKSSRTQRKRTRSHDTQAARHGRSWRARNSSDSRGAVPPAAATMSRATSATSSAKTRRVSPDLSSGRPNSKPDIPAPAEARCVVKNESNPMPAGALRAADRRSAACHSRTWSSAEPLDIHTRSSSLLKQEDMRRAYTRSNRLLALDHLPADNQRGAARRRRARRRVLPARPSRIALGTEAGTTLRHPRISSACPIPLRFHRASGRPPDRLPHSARRAGACSTS